MNSFNMLRRDFLRTSVIGMAAAAEDRNPNRTDFASP